MKKLLLVLLIGISFIGCEKDPDIIYVDNTPPTPTNCNCGKVTWRNELFPGAYQVTVTGNCGGTWTGFTDGPHLGTVCFGDIRDLDGNYVVW